MLSNNPDDEGTGGPKTGGVPFVEKVKNNKVFVVLAVVVVLVLLAALNN
jgi:hypothetical protein